MRSRAIDPSGKPSHDSYAALRVPVFRRFVLTAFVVQVGTAAQSVAIGWEMYQRTDRALALGLVGLPQAIPMLLPTLPAGYLTDPPFALRPEQVLGWLRAAPATGSIVMALILAHTPVVSRSA